MTEERPQAKVLTCSDGVIHGTRQDKSGDALEAHLTSNGFDVVERRVTEDGTDPVARNLIEMCTGFSGLVVTTGGTGFAPRDLTPERSRWSALGLGLEALRVMLKRAKPLLERESCHLRDQPVRAGFF